MSKVTRTRFAPSPTGFLHVGGVRTALFAWLVAKQANGKFLLRIEDTDKAREVKGSEQHIIDSLKWLGINPDEEVYKQSDRLELYEKKAYELVGSGRAYADNRTPAELDEIRNDAVAKKRPILFREYRPDNPPAWKKGMPLRFKSEPKDYAWTDAVMGQLNTGPEVVDDFILMKSDGFPTYNFAHIVDDDDMEITHVIRSQEFLASVPKYLNLYEALGVQVPIFATLPYVMGDDGHKKLSKRDGAKDVLEYRTDGYLPDALVNFLATLGWNDGTEQEIFTTAELIAKFDLSRVQKSGAKFDPRRLEWMNGAHLRKLSLDELYKRAEDFWPKEAEKADETYKRRVLGLVQERLKYLAELPELTKFFFVDLPADPNLISNHKQLKKLSTSELKKLLEQSRDALKDSDFSQRDLSDKLNGLLEKTGQKPAVLFSLIRIATTQAPASPELSATLAVLGRDRSLYRIDAMLSEVK
ncbi:MAG TPA: glutamate--tRNA ligase [Patescibacteria group bacterium]|nr:glutamate--tRNA ligase [Patescibacteria group bacterium]